MTLPKIDKKHFARQAAGSNGRFTVSGRLVPENLSLSAYLKIYYPYLGQEQVESVFGFALEYLPLYGGRGRNKGTLVTERHLAELYGLGMGFSLTLSNHYFSEAALNATRRLLDKLHRRGNSITCVNEDLARRIRDEFPEFTITASLIKGIDTLEKVEQALALYDHVVIPMEKNDDDAFLNALPDKERIILFANANCAYNCPSRTCYLAISKQFAGRGKDATAACSRGRIQRERLPHFFFDIERFETMGFRHFKLIPENTPYLRTVAEHFSTPG